MKDLGEAEAAVVPSQATCSLETACPSSVIISWGLEPVCSMFYQPRHALNELAGLEGLICIWRRSFVMSAILSTIMSPSIACHFPNFLSKESFLFSEHLQCLCFLSYAKSPKSSFLAPLETPGAAWKSLRELIIPFGLHHHSPSVPLTVPICLCAHL